MNGDPQGRNELFRIFRTVGKSGKYFELCTGEHITGTGYRKLKTLRLQDEIFYKDRILHRKKIIITVVLASERSKETY